MAVRQRSRVPGATGRLEVETDGARGDRLLKLVGDFTGGGGYVQAGRAIADVPVRTLSFRVRSPNTDRITLRLGDGSGQTHQFDLALDSELEWQRVVVPIEDFFAKRGRADAVTVVRRYQSWGGAKDGNWHGPARGLYILLGNDNSNTVKTLWLGEVSMTTRPTAVPGEEAVVAVPLDEIVEGVHEWRFSNGQEFKGATGELAVAENTSADGASALRLAGNFTGGGAYVAAIRDLSDRGESDTRAIRFRARTTNARSFSVQLVDASGQTHQRKALPLKTDGEWQDVLLDPRRIAGGEHWGGANDAEWHGPARKLVLSLTTRSDPDANQPSVLLHDVRADIVLPVFARPPAYRESFESIDLDESWSPSAGVSVQSRAPDSDEHTLTLSRTLEGILEPCHATGPAFEASPGKWQLRLDNRHDLASPDNSYSGVVAVECLDNGGRMIERLTVVDVFRHGDWTETSKVVEFPRGTTAARFRVQLNKTHGRFDIDELSAAYLAPPPRRDDTVERLLLTTDRVGNLLYPDDPRRVGITVRTTKPLPASRREVICVVRDYWGAEWTRPISVPLGPPRRERERFVHSGTLDLADVPLEIGRYYEVHGEIPFADGEPFRHQTSLAILPEAVTKQYRPEDVPFTARNWDNRITEYVRLTDRLGVRVCGLWGRWGSKPPYKPSAPQIELVEELGMGWLTNTAAASIERGSKEYDETALRKGVRNLIETYGRVRPLTVNLGNEPHGTGDVVRRNVEAYRVLYDEIKKVDPMITVVATSVEPNEEYFRLGYGKHCDAFDFHIYEDSANVRRTIGEYRELMRRYDVEKPIWSTELGLNSQGLPRHRVAVELVRKFSVFFAAGGENVSWFGLLYPDPDGKQFGSSGDSHNVFDCRFNAYAPRLDAVAYYHAVNAIAIKKFRGEREYSNGVHAFLFADRDGGCLQVLWNDSGRTDVLLPLPGTREATVIGVDGRTRTVRADRGIPLSVSADPLMVVYENSEPSLAESLPASPVTFDPPASLPSERSTITVRAAADVAPRVSLEAPPFWTVERAGLSTTDGESEITFGLVPPKPTSVREVELVVTHADDDGHRRGEQRYRIPLTK